jgi:hypothetical protein
MIELLISFLECECGDAVALSEYERRLRRGRVAKRVVQRRRMDTQSAEVADNEAFEEAGAG